MRVAEQRRGQAEPAVHAAGESAQPLVRQAAEADEVDEVDEVEHVVGAVRRDADRGAENAQMPAGRAGGVCGYAAEDDAELAGGVRDTVQRAAAEEGDAAAVLELQHQPQGSGLARGGRAEQDGDPARPCFKGEVVDGGR